MTLSDYQLAVIRDAEEKDKISRWIIKENEYLRQKYGDC